MTNRHRLPADGFRYRFHVNTKCLAAFTGQALSHNDVLHATLDTLKVSRVVYGPALDNFQACDLGGQPHVARSEK